MTKRTRSRPAAASKADGVQYVGDQKFEGVDVKLEDFEGVDMLEIHRRELPVIGLAITLLNLNDTELEERVRKISGDETGDELIKFLENVRTIADRHRSLVESLDSVEARFMIVVSRLLHGPNPAPWAAGVVADRKGAGR